MPLPATGPALRARLALEPAPLVDPVADRPDRRILTFTWEQDRDHPADRVVLVANKLTDLGDPGDCELEPVPDDPGLLAGSYEVPADWRGSYLFAPSPGEASADPRNPDRIASKWEVGDLSLVSLPEAPDPGPWRRPPGALTGTTERLIHRSAALGNERAVWVARTAGAEDTPPERVLLLLDGEVWAEVLPVLPMLDTLHATGRIPSTLVVMVHSLGPQRREVELTCNPDLLDLLVEVTGEACRRHSVTPRPEATVIAGQSLGGLTAAYAALARPDIFANALCQSPSLWWPNRPGQEEWLTMAVREATPSEGAPRHLGLQVGTDEWVLTGPARRFVAAVTDRSAAVGDLHLTSVEEFSGGHDHACWQAGLARGLTPLLSRPVPLP